MTFDGRALPGVVPLPRRTPADLWGNWTNEKGVGQAPWTGRAWDAVVLEDVFFAYHSPYYFVVKSPTSVTKPGDLANVTVARVAGGPTV